MRHILRMAALAALISGPASAEPISSGMADGTRYDGPAYSTIGVRAGDPVECREACRGDLQCYAWNYQKQIGGEATSRCELLATVPTLVWDDTSISGEIGRSQPAPDPDEVIGGGGTPVHQPPATGEGPGFWDQFAMSEESEAAGAAYSSWTYLGKGDGGLTRCAKACAGDRKCNGFVVRSDPETAPRPNVLCELKSAPGNLLRNPDATTGLKR